LKELKNLKKEDYLQKEISRQVSIIVKNPYIKREAWRVRASAWFVPSLLFIIFAAATFFERVVLSIHFDPNLLWGVWIVLGILISGVTLYLYWSLPACIGHLYRYSYLDKIIDLEQLERPDLFVDSPSESLSEFDVLKGHLKRVQNQLSILAELLKVGDWSLYLDRWDGICHWLHHRVVTQVESDMAYYLVKPISDYYKMLHQKKANNPVDETSTMIESKRELRWICYFYRECVSAIKKREAKKKSSKIDSLPLPKFTEEHDQL
jgi:hypothetical protein